MTEPLGQGVDTRAVRPAKEPVRGAGGIVWRLVTGGAEVLLVHRPGYDDWTFPKGKAEPGEADQHTALREVSEETGLTCRLGVELPSTTYMDHKGRRKTVRYWAMTLPQGSPGAKPGAATMAPSGQNEVDEVSWELVPQARRKLSYARDVVVLDGFEHLVLDSLSSKVVR